MTSAWLLLFFGAFLLYLGAELLVRSAVRIARHFKISRLVIGLTIVAFSTSTPEAIVSMIAQLEGSLGDIALGNIIGSNIANIGVVLGIYLLIRPCDVSYEMKWQKIPILLFVYLLMFLVMLGGKISKAEGAFLFLVMILYLVYEFFFPPKPEELKEEIEIYNDAPKTRFGVIFEFLGVLGSVGLLIFGTQGLLDGAIKLANHYGISERVIAISVVAFGTSLPELATAIIAAFRKQQEIFVGTIIGSNIFNPLLIIPCATFVKAIHFSPKMLMIDFPLMVGFTILLWILMILGHNRLSRLDGAILLLAYFSYITFLYV